MAHEEEKMRDRESGKAPVKAGHGELEAWRSSGEVCGGGIAF
jgi:hypothetical protein